MVDTAAADHGESATNNLDSFDTVNQDGDNSGTTVDLNGDSSVVPAETQETQDITMSDQPGASANPENALPESRIPAKKDATLREFLSKMDDHAPIVSNPLNHSPSLNENPPN